MAELASNPERRAAMGRAARRRYDAFFSPAAVLPLLVEQYQRLMRTASRSSPAHPWAS